MRRFVNSVRHLADWPGFWRRYYALRRPGPRPGEIRVALRAGMTALVPPDLMSAFDEVFLREVYRGAHMDSLPERPLILDVGANAGFFSLYALARRPAARIVAFEPLPSLIRVLERQWQLNPGRAVTLDSRAIAGRAGTVEMHFDGRRDLTVGASMFRGGAADTIITAEATTLNRVFDEYAIEWCHVLKLDCEGAEFEILQNCSDRVFGATDRIVLEMHARVGGVAGIAALVRLLRDHGYRVHNRKNEILTARR